MVGSVGSSYGSVSGYQQMQRPSKEEMFNKVDGNGDGGIDLTELTEMTSKMSEKSGQTVNAEEMLTEFDADQDGMLSQSEMDSAMSAMREKMGPPPGPPPGMGMGAYGMSSSDQSQSLLDLLNQDTEEDTTSSLFELTA